MMYRNSLLINVLIKYTNFCNKNFLAPLFVKLTVLDTCVASSLIYGSETWADNGKEVEIIYRSGLRTALGIRTNVNNEIVYIESSKYPLKCRISKCQRKFWFTVKDYIVQNPDSALKHLLDTALEMNLPYIKHYVNLEHRYESPDKCRRELESEFMCKWKAKFENASNDSDSRLGTYLQVNPTLCTPQYMSKIMFETDRLILTRFRCGSHSLLIERGRFSNIPRGDRICSCDTGVQTILHCFTDCPLLRPLLQRRYSNLVEVFEDENICSLLHNISKELKIPV